MRVGSHRYSGTTRLVERGDKVFVGRFIRLVNVHPDRAVAVRTGNIRQTLAAPFLVDTAILRGEIGEHGRTDGARYFLI